MEQEGRGGNATPAFSRLRHQAEADQQGHHSAPGGDPGRGRQAGLFRTDIDAVELHMVISAMCVFKIANRHTFKPLYGRDLSSPALRDRVKEIICETVIRLLAP